MPSSPNPALRSERAFRLTLIFLPTGLLFWLAGWLLHFRPSLINDEYAAIDYFYRVADGGKFFATPAKIQKPFSVLMGFFSWISESPLGLEAVTAAFAVALLIFFCLIVKRLCGPGFAVIAGLILALHPDLIYYSATGSTVITFTALTLIAGYAVLRRGESPVWLWVYAGAFLVGGLFRPESWLFAGPALYWWWPGLKDKKGLLRLLIALSIIGLGPVIWFGQDLLIHGGLFHSFQVATRDKAVGTGAPYSMLQVLKFFPVRISERVSWPVALFGLFGLIVFTKSQGLKQGLTHPLLVFLLLVSGYVTLIVYGGVYPVQRYWFFHGVIALIFCAWLIKLILDRVRLSFHGAARKTIWLASLFPLLGLLLVRPESSPPDGLWLLLALGFLAINLAAALIWPKEIFARAELSRTGLLGAMVLVFLSYPVFGYGLYLREFSELELEVQKQRELIEVADYLRAEIPKGGSSRILIPSRRNEQFSWQFRDRELPETITFREIFYLYWVCTRPDKSPVPVTDDKQKFCAKMNRITPPAFRFLALRPDWVVYIPDDFQFWGPEDYFDWLKTTDHARYRNTENPADSAELDLVMATGLIRVFRVTYSEAHPPRRPLISLP